jgi:cytochrome c oxidase subunit 3
VKKNLGGGKQPMGASYGKLMMWFLSYSDAFNVLWILAAYGFLDLNLLKHGHWPMRFTHFPFMHGVSALMYYVALMTLF